MQLQDTVYYQDNDGKWITGKLFEDNPETNAVLIETREGVMQIPRVMVFSHKPEEKRVEHKIVDVKALEKKPK